MPIKGTFDADFEDFKKEVDLSTEKLKAMETEADRVGVAVDKAVDTGGGGGLSTMADGASQLATELQDLGKVATTTGSAVGGLGDSLDAMAQFGIQAVSASEAADAGFGKMGKSADSLGSTLSLAAKTQLAEKTYELSYAVTRAGMEFFQLDQYVAHAWTSLLGFGDASKAAAAAAGDTLAKASAIAGREIRDLDEAIKIVTQHQAELNASLLRSQGPAASAKAFQDWRLDLEKLHNEGLLDAVRKDIDSQAFSLGELATRYQVSTGALQLFRKEEQAEADFQKQTEKMLDEFLARQDQADKDRKKKQDDWIKLVEDVRAVERNQFADRTVGLLGVSALQQQTSQKNFEAISKEIGAHQQLVKTIQDELKAAEAINTARNLGPGTDVGLDAASQRDRELTRISGLGARAPELNLGPLILKTWQDFDAMVIAGAGKGGLAAPAPPITVNVSGVFDPASVRQLTDVIGSELIRRTGTDRFLPAR
jgi:hypothetical protein